MSNFFNRFPTSRAFAAGRTLMTRQQNSRFFPQEFLTTSLNLIDVFENSQPFKAGEVL
jgi:hypothetical protein